jgi:predicted Zn-dependent protease
MRGERRILGSFLACAVALAGACSSSPKSDGKKQRTILSTEYDDARVGQQASEDVAAQIGVLEDAPVNAYVNEIGRKLLRGMPRRSFHYQFAVVDQVEPNAFALPGGYIFISRGLLELANDEDELANVIGHEITHSARRHAAAQQEASKRGNPLNPYMRASSQAAYGRDMERTADKGGQMLAAAAGYDPLGMSRFLKSLGQMERFQLGYTRGPSMFATHPGTDERSAATAARAQEIRWKRDPGLGDTRVRYLKRIEGLPVGQRPEAGIFEGERFVHPDLDFQVMFPRGWQTSNTNMRVGAMSPRGDALVYLSADLPSGDPRTVAETFLEKTDELQGIQIQKSQPVKVGGLDAWRMQVEAGSRSGALVAHMTFIPYRGATWRITGLSPAFLASKYEGTFLRTARSFRPLPEAERDSFRATRLAVVTARPGEDLEALAERTGNLWDVQRTAVSNGIFVNHRFEGGELVKISKEQAYTPRS